MSHTETIPDYTIIVCAEKSAIWKYLPVLIAIIFLAAVIGLSGCFQSPETEGEKTVRNSYSNKEINRANQKKIATATFSMG